MYYTYLYINTCNDGWHLYIYLCIHPPADECHTFYADTLHKNISLSVLDSCHNHTSMEPTFDIFYHLIEQVEATPYPPVYTQF